jgi:steroid 5-alpha reductase family enzyme
MLDFSTMTNLYFKIAAFQIPYMTLAWILCIVLRNGSFVDFAWPSGFLFMTIQLFYEFDGNIHIQIY